MIDDDLKWEDGKAELPDGATIQLRGGKWELTTASGKHHRGTEPTQDLARKAALFRYWCICLKRWMRGRPGRRGGFVCEVT